MSATTETAGTSALTKALPTSQTSSLERYLAQIPDPALRESISREIAGMGRNFGLVFERHHPEGLKLPKHRVKRGSKVIINSLKDSPYFRVSRLAKDTGTALLVDEDGHEATYPVDQLTVAKEFGDVMYPGLRKLSEVRNGAPDAPVHTIINGENYHALEALQYTHAGKVDLIYIDPPYNTGNADWKYNDRYIDSKDGYRHSKWLSFMEKRLLIAKRLLKPTGVVAVSIDGNEHARLRLLMSQVFGEGNCLGDVAVVNNLKGRSDDQFFATAHESLMVYARDALQATVRGFEMNSEQDSEYKLEDQIGRYKEVGLRKTGKTSKREDRPNMYYPIYFNPTTEAIGLSPSSGSDVEVLPHDTQGVHGRWRWGTETFLAKKDTELVVRKAAGRWNVYVKMRDMVGGQKRTRRPKTVWIDPRYDTGKGTSLIKEIFSDPEQFTNPKPIEFITDILRVCAGADAVVLDFFGGSGTTADAVVRLNAEDGGSRQSILVTNNELAKKDDAALRKAGHTPGDDAYEALGVFHSVTKPRLETVVTGVRQDGSKYSEGLAANVAFFELTYLDEPEIVTGRALNDLAGLFWLKAGGIGGTVELDTGAKAEGFAISESGSTAILFSPGRASTLAEKLAANDQPISHLFIVTDSEAQGDEAASHFAGGITVERIYGSYLEAFQVNRKD